MCHIASNLKRLKYELETLTYTPSPLTTFIIRDPKTRKISASHFRDRVVHHALCNVIEPILSKNFIYDSFANQKGKGAHLAIKRFEQFLRKIKVQHRRTLGGGGNVNFSIRSLLMVMRSRQIYGIILIL